MKIHRNYLPIPVHHHVLLHLDTNIMSSDLTVQEPRKIFKETGSPLDTTDFSRITVRAGAHDTRVKPVDISAFSFSKRTSRQSPEKFVKKHTGFGGMLVSILVASSFSIFNSVIPCLDPEIEG
jgi:hypothetical protein